MQAISLVFSRLQISCSLSPCTKRHGKVRVVQPRCTFSKTFESAVDSLLFPFAVDPAAPCFLPDTDINGTELARVDASGPADCQQFCVDNADCTVWIFWGIRCFLKNTTEGCGRFERTDYTSGPRVC